MRVFKPVATNSRAGPASYWAVAWRLLLAAWLAAVATAGATEAGTSREKPHFAVLAHVDPGGGYTGDVVGERHYAYLSSHKGGTDCPAQGVRVYDLADPRHPRHLATFASAHSVPALEATWTEKTIVRRVHTAAFDGVLAVTSVQSCSANAFGGFALYDVTRPGHPRRLALVRTVPRGSHEIWLVAARGHAWVYTAEAAAEFSFATGNFGFHIFDVSNPRKPAEVGGWSACRDLNLCSSPSGSPRYLVHSVITNPAATRAFLSYWDLGTVILDIADPARPRYLGRTSPPQGETHSAWLAEGGRILVETHETAHGRPVVYDVADPAHPRRLAVIRLPAGTRAGGKFTGLKLGDSVHDPKVAGKLAYFSWYAQGVPLYDFSNPAKPRYLTRFRPPAEPDRHGLLCPGASCTAVWGVFPTAGYVLVSDINSGLWVLRLRR
jgi:hypothetical protein